jgi:predicted esterase
MKKSFLYLLISLLPLLSCIKENEAPSPWSVESLSEVRGYRNWFIDNFRCGVFIPPSYDPGKKYPLVIFLHGYTDTTTWNLGWYNEPILSSDPCIVLTPKCPKEEIFGWGDSFDPRTSPMMAKAFEMIDLTKDAFNLDPERYYLYGSSMGGYGTYGALQKKPGMFAAAYVECGKPNIAIAPLVATMPIWIFHGSEDNVVPVQPTRDFYKAVLENGGNQIRYTEYKGVGHNAWDYTKYETTLASWLLAQKKGSLHNPPQIIGGFSALSGDANTVIISWVLPPEKESTADNRVWYCRIYRNGNAISEVYNNKTTYIDTLAPGKAVYEYRISTVNFYFRESVLSEAITVITE